MLVCTALTVLAGCAEGAAPGSSSFNLSPDQDRVRVAKVDAIAAEVPEGIRKRGTLVVTGDANSSPPLRFYADDDKTMIGIETDIAYLVADILGLRVDLRSADWAQNFVKVDSGEVDAFISNVTVTEERKEKFDFATYRLDNVTFEARRSLDWKVKGARDIAGKTIGVGSGTNQEALLVRWNEENVAAGLPAADLKYFQQATGYYLALASGRIDAYVGPNPSAVFHSEATGQTKLVGTFSGAGEALQGRSRCSPRRTTDWCVPMPTPSTTPLPTARIVRCCSAGDWKTRQSPSRRSILADYPGKDDMTACEDLLQFVTVGQQDPLAAPLLAELAVEYSTRYGGTLAEHHDLLVNYPAAHFSAPDGGLLVGLQGGAAVTGGAFQRYDANTAELKRIWTSSAHRRQGLAGRTLAALEVEIRRRGYRRIYLTTGPRQPEAKALYLSAGYRPLYDQTLTADEVGIHPFDKDL